MTAGIKKLVELEIDIKSVGDLRRLKDGDASIEEIAFYAKLFAEIVLCEDNPASVTLKSKD